MQKKWLLVAVPLLAIGAFAAARKGSNPSTQVEELPLSRRIFRPGVESDPAFMPKLTGLDMTQLHIEDGAVTTELADKTRVKLTVDGNLQKTVSSLLASYAIPESAVVLMEVATGRVLVYASHIEGKPARDLNVEATAPAASVFKVITGASLIDYAALKPESNSCYSGGEQRINASDLEEDPARDKYCTSLSGAMGRSINTVFARLAQKHLSREQLGTTANAMFFGQSLPFDVAVAPSALAFPDDSLGFARTAAGFWNTTLSPIHAAWISATIARGGEPVRPTVIAEVARADGKKLYALGDPKPMARALSPATAEAVTTMMENTISDGTCFRAFHDRGKTAFLPGITVAGKTGTLTDNPNKRFYTWFTGFAPSHAPPGAHAVAVSVMVANGPIWKVKANLVAREVLRAYFAQEGVKGVTKPSVHVEPEAKARVASATAEPR
jgi:penicillin-binding protein A